MDCYPPELKNILVSYSFLFYFYKPVK